MKNFLRRAAMTSRAPAPADPKRMNCSEAAPPRADIPHEGSRPKMFERADRRDTDARQASNLFGDNCAATAARDRENRYRWEGSPAVRARQASIRCSAQP